MRSTARSHKRICFVHFLSEIYCRPYTGWTSIVLTWLLLVLWDAGQWYSVRLNELTGGESLRANLALVKNNARVGAQVASVADPDPCVFWPPGSGSINQRYGSGSGSLYHQAKLVRKTLIPTVLWLLFDFFIFKNYLNVPSKSNKHKNFSKLVFCWRLESQWRK